MHRIRNKEPDIAVVPSVGDKLRDQEPFIKIAAEGLSRGVGEVSVQYKYCADLHHARTRVDF